ncbi:short chain dehydrogenase [Glaciecola punicea ACAM 611]|jgi:hypothetical protein|uniref:Short chain dehydrogenase n=1 Tax=Glaciecola punicea ACAM 611 TaxID=1121923 RepID=H5TCF5_9ALTE|nr:hypothetical protein [Glaciecola punicea]GAB55982.1 short chain dehydrogenase [Glaciecola punicea ACAM 611]
MIRKSTLVIAVLFAVGLAGCASTQPPRDVDTIQSSKSKTLTDPKITESDGNSLEITYAEISMGFDSSCNPYQSFSDELNDCSQLPENVKVMAIAHCEVKDKKAVFHGSGKNLLQMTVSKFTCETKNS